MLFPDDRTADLVDGLEVVRTATCSSRQIRFGSEKAIFINGKSISWIALSVALQYFPRRNRPSDSEVETVDDTTPLGCNALTRRPGRSVGTTDH
jgi:hypothetical protein